MSARPTAPTGHGPSISPSQLTATEACALVRAGELLPSEWLEACLAAVDEWEPTVQAWAFLNPQLARDKAGKLDNADWSAWRPAPLLAGLPLGVKDIFNSEDMPTQHGSTTRAAYTPGNDARVVFQGILSGAYVMGKAVTAEFAVHTPGQAKNPLALGRITGTSSSGSAVSVRCGMTPAALGTQSAASILRPSSYVGIVGFKPSFGLIPRTGVLKTCDTLDTIGWMTRAVTDAELLLNALRVRGRDYPNVERGLAAAARFDPDKPLRLGYCMPPKSDLVEPFTRDSMDRLVNELGNRPDIRIDEVDLRGTLADSHETHRKIYHKSLSYYFQRELKQSAKISDVFLRIVEDGTAIALSEYEHALDRQQELSDAAAAATEGFDALIMPTVAGEAPPLGVEEKPDACLIWTLCGMPSMSLPMLTGPSGLPMGVQLVGARYGDYTLLYVARRIFPDTVEPLRAEGRRISAPATEAVARRGGSGSAAPKDAIAGRR